VRRFSPIANFGYYNIDTASAVTDRRLYRLRLVVKQYLRRSACAFHAAIAKSSRRRRRGLRQKTFAHKCAHTSANTPVLYVYIYIYICVYMYDVCNTAEFCVCRRRSALYEKLILRSPPDNDPRRLYIYIYIYTVSCGLSRVQSTRTAPHTHTRATLPTPAIRPRVRTRLTSWHVGPVVDVMDGPLCVYPRLSRKIINFFARKRSTVCNPRVPLFSPPPPKRVRQGWGVCVFVCGRERELYIYIYVETQTIILRRPERTGLPHQHRSYKHKPFLFLLTYNMRPNVAVNVIPLKR